MPLEIEIKLQVDAHEPVREKLVALGATRGDRVVETNEIFDRPDGSLRGQGCGLRVRALAPEDGGSRLATLTFKGPRLPGPMKSREELEVEVSDSETTAGMLAMLGFVRILRYEKRRESWQWRGCCIELDTPPHIGLFIEIEGPSEDVIRQVQAELGLAEVPHVKPSYVRMLSEYCSRNGIVERDLALS